MNLKEPKQSQEEHSLFKRPFKPSPSFSEGCAAAAQPAGTIRQPGAEGCFCIGVHRCYEAVDCYTIVTVSSYLPLEAGVSTWQARAPTREQGLGAQWAAQWAAPRPCKMHANIWRGGLQCPLPCVMEIPVWLSSQNGARGLSCGAFLEKFSVFRPQRLDVHARRATSSSQQHYPDSGSSPYRGPNSI